MEKSEKSNGTTITAIAFILISCVLTYISIDLYLSNHILAKPTFICTKVEQAGKNLDDVTCVQYTNQKYYAEVVAINKSIELVNTPFIAQSKPAKKTK